MTGTTIVEVGAPGGVAPQRAVAFGAAGATAIPVDGEHPLPTAATMLAATSTPLTGTSAVAATVGPFAPQLARPIWVTLSGTWSGTVRVLRSTDSGVTKLPLTAGGASWGAFSAAANEPVAEESVAGATYYLQVAPASGTVAYEIRQ